MVSFMKEFRIVAVIDYHGYNEDKEKVAELNKQIDDIAKQFRLSYQTPKRRVYEIPQGMKKRDNMLLFGTGEKLQLTWRCATSWKWWWKFYNEANEYVKGKDYEHFTVFDSPV